MLKMPMIRQVEFKLGVEDNAEMKKIKKKMKIQTLHTMKECEN